MNTFKDFIIVIKLQAEGSVAGLVTCNTRNVPSTLLVQLSDYTRMLARIFFTYAAIN